MTHVSAGEGHHPFPTPPGVGTPGGAQRTTGRLALDTAARAITARCRPTLASLGLTYPPQYLVMVLLWEESSCSVGRVGARLSLESSTLSHLETSIRDISTCSIAHDLTRAFHG